MRSLGAGRTAGFARKRDADGNGGVLFSLDFSRKRALAPSFLTLAGQTMFLRQNVVIWCDVEVVFGAFRA